ncbi:Transposase IS200-family protein [Sulfitobacter noctilucae]|uniref:REP-associated tyrosine transposase n=1 Tax=Sulfitobacter noctilucae TaxID=1342302 RepID=UPI00046A61F7|nr:transposase [Sulfitobacter noctilucae]KIN61458.1 Transposase IS200-family protein [Sulfitobacter noctilucae]
MSHSICPKATGTTHFLTIRLADRQSDLLVRRIDQLRQAMRATLAKHPFRIDAIAILPNTIHALWTMPEGDPRCDCRVALLKSRFSRMQPAPMGRNLAKVKRADKGIWQRYCWVHPISNRADFERHRNLIYLSPVQSGLCAQPQDWPHSSLHRDRQLGQMKPPMFAPAADHQTSEPKTPYAFSPADAVLS